MIRKQIIQKVAIGLVAILLAAGVTYIIKDLLAMRNPESALPDIEVRYDTAGENPTVLPEKNVMRVAYVWRFFNRVVDGEVPPSEWENMDYGYMLPNIEMDFSFSHSPKNVKVSVAKVADNYMPPTEQDFVRMQPADELVVVPGAEEYSITTDNQFLTPMEPGLYVYKVEADWGWRGTVLYYFKINVPVLN